jgi:hypothetical protein
MLLIEQQNGAESPHVGVDQLTPALELGAKHGIPGFVGVEWAAVHHERAGHAGLDDQARRVELEHRMLGPAVYLPDGLPRQAAEELSPSNPAQNVIMIESDSADAAAEEAGAEIPYDGFDFG